MNKYKQTVFVEGLAEQIFVRHLLEAWFEYDGTQLGFSCLTLHKEQHAVAPYPFGSKDSCCYYQIINVGNDAKVVGEMLRMSQNLHENGYSVLGLRDMYSQEYVAHAKKHKLVAVYDDLNDRFSTAVNRVLDEAFSSIRHDVQVRFAIMEVEVWLLAINDGGATADIESIFHPVIRLKESIMNDYDKHGEQVEKLVAKFDKEACRQLYQSNRCPSFNAFFDCLIPQGSMA